MYGPAVRRKKFRRFGFRSCMNDIRPKIGAVCLLRAIMDIRARGRSHYRTGLEGPSGSPVFARAGKTGLHLVVTSRRPRGQTSSLPALSRPAPRGPPDRSLASTVLSTARGLKRLRCNKDLFSRHFESALLGEQLPKRYAPACWQARSPARCGEAAFCGLEPGFEPVTFPAHRLDENDPGRLHERDPQIAISPLRDLAQDGAISCRDLLWHEPSQAAKSRPFENASPEPIAATIALEMIGPMPGTLMRRSQPVSCRAINSISRERFSMRSSRRRQSPPRSSMTRSIRADSTSVREARMIGSSARKKRMPWRTAMPRFSKKARI